MFARRLISLLTVLMLAAALTGCMSTGDETASATDAPGMTGAVTAEPTERAQSASGTAFDWNSGAQDVENAIIQLSEVKDARVVVAGSTALVGVKFDDAYKGEMTERIREMIAGVVKQADTEIETVAVTDETDDVEGIYDISDKVRGGKGYDEFKNDINAIVRNATTMR